MVEAAGVEPASEINLKSGHPQVCLDFFGVQNSYPQISRFLCGLGNPPATSRVPIFDLIYFGGAKPLIRYWVTRLLGSPAIKQLVRNCMQRYR